MTVEKKRKKSWYGRVRVCGTTSPNSRVEKSLKRSNFSSTCHIQKNSRTNVLRLAAVRIIIKNVKKNIE